MTRAVLVAAGVSLLIASTHAQKRNEQSGFPHTKRHGKAIVEYRDDDLDVVLSYEYSQKNHDTPWLLIDFGMRAEHQFVIEREHIRLVSETGEWFPVASERHFVEDAARITHLRQNATIWRRDLTSYLGHVPRTPMKFFALPGEGVIITGALVDREHNTLGELYFEHPGGSWLEGDYALLIEHPNARLKLPLELH
jgi:K+ transporter